MQHDEKPLSRYGNNKSEFHDNSDLTLASIRDVSKEHVTRYGTKRMAMREIAQSCRISPAALYHRFSSKESLLEALSDWIVRSALKQAESRWTDGDALATNLKSCINGRDAVLRPLIHETPHGLDLIYTSLPEVSVWTKRLEMGFSDVLEERIGHISGLDFSGYGDRFSFCRYVSKVSLLLNLSLRASSDYEISVDSLAKSSALSLRA